MRFPSKRAVSFGVLWAGAAVWLGCSSASDRQTGLRTSSDGRDSAPADRDGTEPSSAPEGGELPVAVDSARDACLASADFVPLGVIPDEYNMVWKAVDPRAGYVYWTHTYVGDDVRVDPYRWTASGGIELLNERLQLPAGEGESYVDWVSSDGRVIFGTRLSDYATDVFIYTPESGTVALDFYPRALSRDGKVAFDFRDGRLLRWTESGEKTELPLSSEMQAWNFGPAQFWLSETGDTLLGVGVLAGTEAHVVRWTTASGWVDLGLLPPRSMQREAPGWTVSEAGNAIAGTLSTPANDDASVFRWTEASGSTDLGALAGLPPEASYVLTHLSADGSVVVGSVQIPGQPGFSSIFRWTEALGMQDLMPGVSDVYPRLMSARGDVVISQGATLESTNRRWTQAGGVEDLDLRVKAASAEGNLLVGDRNGKPAIVAFGDGNSPSPTLAELAPPTIVPADWSEASIEGVSADGHLIVGTARSPQGEREAWLLRRTERCAAPQ